MDDPRGSGSGRLGRLIRWVAGWPLVYDAIQVLGGSYYCRRRLRAVAPRTPARRVLDVGAGTGNGQTASGAAGCYVGLDLDLAKLVRLRGRYREAAVLCADARALPVRTGAFDAVTCALVFHHLDDGALRAVLTEMARVCRGTVMMMDALMMPSRRLSRLLWRYDLGAFPRPRATLLAEIERVFEVEHLEEFSVFHRYIACRCRPRRARSDA